MSRVYPNTEYGSKNALSDALLIYCGFGFSDEVAVE